MKKITSILFVLLTLCNSYATRAQTAPTPQEAPLKKIVIDAGHGGKDAGALSPDKKTREKDINLSVAKYLGAELKTAYPHIEILYTRSTDTFVPLDQRGRLATEQHADLFISIHVNSTRSTTNTAIGPETWVFGADRSARNDSSYDVVLKENAVIKYEDNYQTKYKGFDPDNPQSMMVFNFHNDAVLRHSKILGTMVQQALREGPLKGGEKDRGMKEGGLMVLAYCSMPSILIELGFLSSAADRKSLTKDSARAQMAHQIFLGIEKYIGTLSTATPVTLPEEAPAKEVATAPATEPVTEPATATSQTYFCVQVLSSQTPVPLTSKEFKGHRVSLLMKENQTYKYKYTLGRFATREEAQQLCDTLRRKDFPNAFVISVQTP